MKIPYEAPKLTNVGSVESITAGMKTVLSNIDATFPAHTPKGKLTYS